ncbi:MAG: aminodeoxychorismate synthase component I, partial [Alphaproteobacteria bacterium]
MIRERMAYLPPNKPFVLLENSRDSDGVGYLFEDPEAIVCAERPQEVDGALAEIQAGVDRGLYAAGWIGYEVGLWLEPKLRQLMPADRAGPLIWMGLFAGRTRMGRPALEGFWRDRVMGRGFVFSPPEMTTERSAYLQAVGKVKDYLAAGDIYQANLTMEAEGTVSGDPMALHAALRKAQPVAFGAFVSTGDRCISSHSPELFVSMAGNEAVVKPMKGTAPRGRWAEEDQEARSALSADAKSQAENLMIVDLERNDLSRLSRPGTVKTEVLFEVEALPTALQMTSKVTGVLEGKVGLDRLLRAIFPCGSVTGAPKVRAMEIIAELEARPRGVYTGAIGQITPDGGATFNVPIRTLEIDGQGHYRFGVGSGIVSDSDAEAEYEECLLKSAFLSAPATRPCLIETMRYEPGLGFPLLDGHLDRLMASATYFGYPLTAEGVRRAIQDHVQDLKTPSRVRLLAAPSGNLSVSSEPIMPAGDGVPTVAWASRAVSSSDPYLFHKTTRRDAYN